MLESNNELWEGNSAWFEREISCFNQEFVDTINYNQNLMKITWNKKLIYLLYCEYKHIIML